MNGRWRIVGIVTICLACAVALCGCEGGGDDNKGETPSRSVSVSANDDITIHKLWNDGSDYVTRVPAGLSNPHGLPITWVETATSPSHPGESHSLYFNVVMDYGTHRINAGSVVIDGGDPIDFRGP
jgi:hypothetical protein